MRLPAVLLLGLLATARAAEPPLDALTRTVAESSDQKLQLNVLRGMNAALKGKRSLPAPKGWPALYEQLSHGSNGELKQQAQTLAVIFGGGSALDDLRRVLGDSAAPAPVRQAALDSLVGARDAASVPALTQLLHAPGPLRQAALRGLANYEQPEIAPAILAAYGQLGSEEKRDAIAALAMRPASARALLAAVDAKSVSRADLSAPIARQLQDLKDGGIDAWLAKNWGAVRTTSAEKQKEIARYKTFLTREAIAQGDPAHGRAIFAQTCAVCHTLFGRGGKIGPELPGAFEDVDYLLQNVIDPNAIIGKDYQQTVLQMKGGQVLMGIVGAEDKSSVTLKTLTGPVSVDRADITQQSLLEISLMPEGLLAPMKQEDVRDLFAYLRRHGPVPMLASPANVNDFFNGADLANWAVSSGQHWEVKNGEIIGHGSADRPEFLTSDLTAGSFRLKARLRLTGDRAWAETALRGGETDGGFTGVALRLSAKGAELVRYDDGKAGKTVALAQRVQAESGVSVEITGHGDKFSLLLDGAPAANFSGGAVTDRTNFRFRVFGKDAEVKIGELALKLE